MGFFGAFKEKLRDKKRDELCANLCARGLDARMAERGLSEERAVGDYGGKSKGLIEIRDSPIRWVNVLKQGGGENSLPNYTNVYLVPDSSVSTKAYLKAKSVRVKSVPLFGKVIDLRWKANIECDLIRQMNEDVLLSRRLITLKEDVEISSQWKYGCWLISSNRYEEKWPRHEWQPVSRQQWDYYEAIAHHLLKS